MLKKAYCSGNEERVLSALTSVPRQGFMPSGLEWLSERDEAFPIGHGQTIPRPSMVKTMINCLSVDKSSIILEVGTGSGYQTAVLSILAEYVYSIEIIKELAEQAKVRLSRLGYNNVVIHIGNGYYGWSKQAPFDRILVSAAVDHIPLPLIYQLKMGGRLVIPIKIRSNVDMLTVVEKSADNSLQIHHVMEGHYVPLSGSPLPLDTKIREESFDLERRRSSP